MARHAATPIPSGVEVSECPFSGCAAPVVSPTEENGVATFTPVSDPITHTPVTEPYFQVGSMPGFYPLILWPYFPLTHTVLLWYPVPDQVTIDKTAENAGVTLEPELGHIAFILSDCTGRPGNSLPVRLKVGTPNARTRIVAYRTVPGSDDVSDSYGIIFNVTPGTNTVETFVDADGGARVGSRDVLVEPGTFTLVSLQPTP